MDYQNLFNQDFYPTPDEVIAQMLSMSDIAGKIILEPQAGKGNIVDYLKQHGAKKVLCCEINRDLQQIVSQKAELIAEDFLTVTSSMISHIDMIVMNPPFSCAKKHILHAFEVAPDGCEIISLCNSSMLDRSYDEGIAQLRELISMYGGTQELGQVFKNGERQTEVWVDVIRLYKPRTGAHEFDGFFDMAEDDEPDTQGLVRYNKVQDLVSKYKDAVEMFDSVMDANKRMNALCESMGVQPIIFGARKNDGRDGYSKTTITRDSFKKTLQKSLWLHVFDEFNMDKYVTQKVIEELNRAIELASNMPFTMKNIYRLVQNLVVTHGDRMQRTLEEAFDYICSLSAENSTAGEKWKTNSDYMINRRFIMPNITSNRWDRGYVDLSIASNTQRLDDVMKALCYITGRDYNDVKSLYSFLSNRRIPWGQWYEWTNVVKDKDGNILREWSFFRIRGYKKGTMHFEFVDEDVWYKFNQAVAAHRGWVLPKQHKQKGK